MKINTDASHINTALLGIVIAVGGFLSHEVTQVSKAVSAHQAVIERIERQLERSATSTHNKRTDRYVETSN